MITIFKEKNKWLTISLANLFIVAILGTALRTKILFSIPWIDFKFLLHAHSHFAFGGWLTLCLFTLMTFEILPHGSSGKLKYRILLGGTFLSATGMLLSFPFQGYGFISIFFSTLFIFVTYAFSWFFIRDLLKSQAGKPIVILSIAALVAADLSSVGPFTLAYMLASHHTNLLLYKDSIYTYLHLQYNGFFSLGVFALFFNQFYSRLNDTAKRRVGIFSKVLSFSVLPTLFLSYLWHFPNDLIRGIAITGCVLLAATLIFFVRMIKPVREVLQRIHPFAKAIGILSMTAFFLKTAVQIGIVIPSVGNEVFGDRPMIIGYLHLVMLGFVSLYLLAHLVHTGFFNKRGDLSRKGIIVFTCAVIGNEFILMIQGLSAMLMQGSSIYPWLLWSAAIFLLLGSLIILLSVISPLKGTLVSHAPVLTVKPENILETIN